MAKHIMQEAVEDAGYETRSYSGRGMFGKECLGVEVDRGSMGSFIADVIDTLHSRVDSSGDDEEAEAEVDDAFDAVAQGFRRMNTDSMGLGSILYFPGVPFEDEDADDDEDEDDEDESAEG